MLSRRSFLQGCCAGLLAGPAVRLGNLAFGAPPGGGVQDILITISLRGGMDALSLLVPHGEANYATSRARLALRSSQVLDLDGRLGLHPSARPLFDLARAGQLAVIGACGLPDPSRSHFDAQDMMDHGVSGTREYAHGGWLARHVNQFSAANIFHAISLGDTVAPALEGANGAIALESARGYTLQGDWTQTDDLRRALRSMYGSDAEFGPTALNLLNATDVIEYAAPDDYTPAPGITYPGGGFGDTLKSLAQIIKLEMGLMAATVDLGGWDTHESQADGNNPTTGYFAQKVDELSKGLAAFWADLADWHGRLTLNVMSEFGRRLKENNNRGTDHGHGGLMLVLSASLSRGGLFGTWPGLEPDQLFERVDLDVTTDYRQVLGEILLARTPTPSLASIFPGYAPAQPPLGLFGTRNAVDPAVARGFLALE